MTDTHALGPSGPAGQGGGTRDALADGADPAGALSSVLAGLGMQCTVEARGSLAIVAPAGGPWSSVGALADSGLRAAVMTAAHDLGFTNVALELRGEDG